MHFVPLYLSISALTPSQLYRSTKAKREYVSTHPECAMCGNQKYLEVHHVVPVHINPSLADQQSNLITLCDGPNRSNSACHRYIGHLGNFRSKYNSNIRAQCIINRYILENTDPKRTFIFTWKQMLVEYSDMAGVNQNQMIDEIHRLSDIPKSKFIQG